MTKVVDASAIAAVLFAEPRAADVVELLADHRLVAPSLLAFELANVCVTKCRRDPRIAPDLIAASTLRHGLDIDELPVDPDQVTALALKTGLTAYDASYLKLALDLDVELVTLDKALAKAWSGMKRA